MPSELQIKLFCSETTNCADVEKESDLKPLKSETIFISPGCSYSLSIAVSYSGDMIITLSVSPIAKSLVLKYSEIFPNYQNHKVFINLKT
jgi:hypothetical protein